MAVPAFFPSVLSCWNRAVTTRRHDHRQLLPAGRAGVPERLPAAIRPTGHWGRARLATSLEACVHIEPNRRRLRLEHSATCDATALADGKHFTEFTAQRSELANALVAAARCRRDLVGDSAGLVRPGTLSDNPRIRRSQSRVRAGGVTRRDVRVRKRFSRVNLKALLIRYITNVPAR